MVTGGTEIYAVVALLDIGNTEAGVQTAVSVEAEFSFGLVLDILNVRVKEAQQLQVLLPMMVVPQNEIVILDGVRACDLADYRPSTFSEDGRRLLDNSDGLTCELHRDSVQLPNQLLTCSRWFINNILWHSFLTTYPRQKKKTGEADEDHVDCVHLSFISDSHTRPRRAYRGWSPINQRASLV